MQYFIGLEESEVKAKYKELAKKHHPDKGGCAETMKIINGQYEQAITSLYQKAGKSITEIEELIARDQRVRTKLNEILQFDGINVEVCGYWIWISGETRIIKDLLKEANFRWAKNKCSWFWRAEEHKSYNRKAMSLDEIREKHGSTSLKGVKKLVLV